MLYRVGWGKIEREKVMQLLVLRHYKRALMRMAYGLSIGGHQWWDKTEARLLGDFYWPGTCLEIVDYCGLCPECQSVAPGTSLVASLVLTTLVESSFKRIMMDVIGPLLKSSSDHEYVLGVLD